MINLRRHEFKCPFCGEEKVTFITDDKLSEIMRREKLMQEIFNPEHFDATYRETFISGICSECQSKVFGNPKNEKDYFDVGIDDNADELEEKIRKIYEEERS